MHDISHDITPLLTSFLASEGSNIRGAVGIGHMSLVVGDAADPSGLTSFVWDAALFFSMPDSIAEQALVDACAVTHQMPVPLAPEAVFVVLIGAVLPPICEVIEPCVKHSSWDV
jgi:hypothetical protein